MRPTLLLLALVNTLLSAMMLSKIESDGVVQVDLGSRDVRLVYMAVGAIYALDALVLLMMTSLV